MTCHSPHLFVSGAAPVPEARSSSYSPFHEISASWRGIAFRYAQSNILSKMAASGGLDLCILLPCVYRIYNVMQISKMLMNKLTLRVGDILLYAVMGIF